MPAAASIAPPIAAGSARQLTSVLGRLEHTIGRTVVKAEQHGALQHEVRLCNAVASLLVALDRLSATNERQVKELEDLKYVMHSSHHCLV